MIQQAKQHVDGNGKAGSLGRGTSASTNKPDNAMNVAPSAVKYPGVTWRLEGEFIRITIPIKLKRKAGRKQIILPPGATPPASLPAAPRVATAQDAIVTALARAFKWQAMLDSGEVRSIKALAKRLRLEASYIRRILRLTCLAPDIVEALLDGNEPDGLSLRKLLDYRAILWTEQREELGFPAK
jgi:hypothetical protein